MPIKLTYNAGLVVGDLEKMEMMRRCRTTTEEAELMAGGLEEYQC